MFKVRGTRRQSRPANSGVIVYLSRLASAAPEDATHTQCRATTRRASSVGGPWEFRLRAGASGRLVCCDGNFLLRVAIDAGANDSKRKGDDIGDNQAQG